MQNPCSADKEFGIYTWNLEYTSWNPEFKIVLDALEWCDLQKSPIFNTYRSVWILLLETFRFKDDYKYEIWLRVFFAYSQNINSADSFILLIFTRKVSTATFSEGGYTLSRWQNDKTTNIWWLVSATSLKVVVGWRRLPHFPAKMTLVHACALLSIEKISYARSRARLRI